MLCTAMLPVLSHHPQQHFSSHTLTRPSTHPTPHLGKTGHQHLCPFPEGLSTSLGESEQRTVHQLPKY